MLACLRHARHARHGAVTALPQVLRAAAPATSSFASSAPPPPAGGEIYEIRRYFLKPEHMKGYLALSDKHGELRRKTNPGFLGFFTCETGGPLNAVTHFYAYDDWDHREAIRASLQKNPEWVAYIDAGREMVAGQESKVLLEASDIHEAAGSGPAASYTSPARAVDGANVVYEYRNYQLHPGYGSVPKLREILRPAIGKKVAADAEGELVMYAYSDVGMLNNVVEVFRYPSAQACIRARQASRGVPEWRAAIGEVAPLVQYFTTEFLVPAKFSPWQ